MNKSNEWHVIIGQGERDGQRVGASGRKPEIICLENLRNERDWFCLFSFLSFLFCFGKPQRLSSAAHVHEPRWREGDHTCARVCCVDFGSTSTAASSFFTQTRWNSSCAASLSLHRVLLLCGIYVKYIYEKQETFDTQIDFSLFSSLNRWHTVKIGSQCHFLRCAASVSVDLSVSHTDQTCPALLRLLFFLTIWHGRFQILLTRAAVMVAKWFSSLPPRRPTKL